MEPTIQRPALRYHGGKWMLADWIIGHFPDHRIYVEPFGGAGSVLFRKRRSYSEVFNDLDSLIVNFFRVLRDQPDDLIRKIELTPFSRQEYTDARADVDDPVESARQIAILSGMGFGSSAATRQHKSGFRNHATRDRITPAHDWATYPVALRKIVERIRGVIIENRPATEVIKIFDRPETLFYIDPPYLPSLRNSRFEYRHEMTEEDHIELAEILRATKGEVVLSGYASPLYDELYSGWEKRGKVSQKASGTSAIESLWIKNIGRRRQGSLFPGS